MEKAIEGIIKSIFKALAEDTYELTGTRAAAWVYIVGGLVIIGWGAFSIYKFLSRTSDRPD
jgi:hypothetical protein